MLEIPIFYFGSDRNEFDFYFSNEDPLITYDSNQEPIYSGVYFSRPGNSKSLFKLTNSNIPEEIWLRNCQARNLNNILACHIVRLILAD